MFDSFANIFRIPELRKRIFVTVALLMVYRIGWNIPLADGSGDSELRRIDNRTLLHRRQRGRTA